MKPLAPATFLGWQQRAGGKPPIALFNLTRNIAGHPAGSTVSDRTLLDAGYRLPEVR